MPRLGDCHNFGRYVRLAEAGDWVFKPRSVWWEWLLLSRESPLKNELLKLGSKTSLQFPFLYPELQFKNISDPFQGAVERLRLAPLSCDRLSDREVEAVGESVAFMIWLGIGDLHRKNIAFGKNANGQIIFAPIDVESILSDIILPSQSHLIDTDLSDSTRGLSALFGLSPPALLSFVRGFVEAIFIFSENEMSVMKTFESPQVFRTPLRVVLRSTQDYTAFLENPILNPVADLIPEERIQLERGDIPYFFRLIGTDQIFYYSTEDQGVSEVKPNHVFSQMHRTFGNTERINFRPQVRNQNVSAAILQLLKYLTRHRPGFEVSERGSRLSVDKNFISLAYAGSTELRIRCAR